MGGGRSRAAPNGSARIVAYGRCVTQIECLESDEQLAELVALLEAVFGPPPTSRYDLRASLLAGGVVLGVRRDQQLVAGLWALAGHDERGAFHHSHMVAVRAELRGQGLGQALKQAHARHCLQRGVERIRWTFDPLMADNARLNLERLGALGDAWIEDCYGPLSGPLDPLERTGADAPSDRLHVSWHLSGRPRLTPTEPAIPLPAGEPAQALLQLRASLAPRLSAGEVVCGLGRAAEGWEYRLARVVGGPE